MPLEVTHMREALVIVGVLGICIWIGIIWTIASSKDGGESDDG
jgi:hypothetical protein